MRKLLLAIAFSFLLQQPLSAADFEFSLETNSVSSQSVNKNITLYNFSDSLLQAAKDCLPYSEDFTQANPSIAKKWLIF